MPRPTKEQLASIRAIGREMESLVASGGWTESAYRELRRRAHVVIPDHEEAYGFLLRAAKPEWLSPAYQPRSTP